MERGGSSYSARIAGVSERSDPAARAMKVREANFLFSAIDDASTTDGCAGAEGSVHVACVVRRGKVLSCGTNRAGSRTSGAGFSAHSLHAERAAVKALGDLSLLRGAELFVGRLPAAGHVREGVASDLLFSRPCHECTIFLEKCMRVWGLRRVFYTTDMNVALLRLRPPPVLADMLDQRPPDEPRARAEWERRIKAQRRCGAIAGADLADERRARAAKEAVRCSSRTATSA